MQRKSLSTYKSRWFSGKFKGISKLEKVVRSSFSDVVLEIISEELFWFKQLQPIFFSVILDIQKLYSTAERADKIFGGIRNDKIRCEKEIDDAKIIEAFDVVVLGWIPL